MKRISEWLRKRPHTKAAWASVVTGIATLAIVAYQTYVFRQQTEILRQQTQILEEQSRLLSNQIQISTTPFVEVTIRSDNQTYDSLWVKNNGSYPIQNIKLHQIYFAGIASHGWYVSLPTNPVFNESLDPNRRWTLDLTNIANPYEDPPVAKSFSVQTEFLVLLVSFKRPFDGKNYLYVLPGYILRSKEGIKWVQEFTSITGPLAKVCYPSIELTFEFMRRRPFFEDYEIYNFKYPFGYAATGCLGPIKWVN